MDVGKRVDVMANKSTRQKRKVLDCGKSGGLKPSPGVRGLMAAFYPFNPRSLIPSCHMILNQEQEASDENRHAPKDKEDDTEIHFGEAANIIHASIDETMVPFYCGLLKPDATVRASPYDEA
jgi:hypothetical protein